MLKGLLRLLRQYLETGIITDGIATIMEKGRPRRAAPLAPLLSNIVLDELDKELESRGHSFCPYAGGRNLYVNSRKAAERVIQSIAGFD